MHRRLLVITALSFALSFLSTLLAMHFLDGTVRILGDFVTLRLSWNPGIAFSLLFPPIVLGALITAALIGVVFYALKTARDGESTLAFGLILGGALSNLLDRVISGAVTDYLSIGTFPIFNTADACISIGAGILIMASLSAKKTRKGTKAR